MLAQPISLPIVNILQLLSTIEAQQVVFIRDENSMDEGIIPRLSSRILTWQVSLSDEVLDLNQSSALFVMTKHPNLPRDVEQRQLRQLKHMSTDSFRSKFLILQPTGNGSETTLRLAWDNYLLDITIVDPREIHHFNPFTNRYHHLIYNTSTPLFPDKLTNLHGHQLKVGVLNYIPYSYVTCDNGSYNFKFIFGEMLKSLSKTVNFRIKPDVATIADYGILLKNGTATGLIGKVIRGELDLVAFGAFLFYSPFATLADRTTYIDIDKGCPVVPLIKLDNAHLFLGASTLGSMVTIAVLTVLVYLFSLLLRLEKRLWHPLHVIFLILGISVSNAPKLLRDRFVYGSIMVVSLFYSSSMFAQLTSISVDLGGFKPFESYKDLDDSGLVPILHPNVYNITFEFTDDKHLKSLGKKSMAMPDFADFCPKWLMYSQNVSCVFENLLANVQVQTNKGKMKIGRPCFWLVTRSFILPRGSPYTQRFNKIIRMVQQSGLQEPWFLRSYYESKKMKNASIADDDNDEKTLDREDVENMLKDDTIKSTRYFVISGYLTATFVFIGELLVFRIRKMAISWQAKARLFTRANQ